MSVVVPEPGKLLSKGLCVQQVWRSGLSQLSCLFYSAATVALLFVGVSPCMLLAVYGSSRGLCGGLGSVMYVVSVQCVDAGSATLTCVQLKWYE